MTPTFIRFVRSPVMQAQLVASLCIVIGGFAAFLWKVRPAFLQETYGDMGMTYSPAVAFFYTGIILWNIACVCKGRRVLSWIGLPFGGLILLLLISLMAIGPALHVYTSIESVSAQNASMMYSAASSIMSMVNFGLVGFLAIFFLSYDLAFPLRCSRFVGLLLCIDGVIACIGYFLKQPLLRFETSWTAGMSLLSAFLFIAIGLCLYAMPRELSKRSLL